MPIFAFGSDQSVRSGNLVTEFNFLIIRLVAKSACLIIICTHNQNRINFQNIVSVLRFINLRTGYNLYNSFPAKYDYYMSENLALLVGLQ